MRLGERVQAGREMVLKQGGMEQAVAYALEDDAVRVASGWWPEVFTAEAQRASRDIMGIKRRNRQDAKGCYAVSDVHSQARTIAQTLTQNSTLVNQN